MNILGFNINISRNPSSHPLAPTERSVTAEEWLRGEDIDSGPVLANAYQQVVWVYRAINALAEQVANVPFLFSAGERGRENLITSGPLLDFYSRPHPQINRFQYWELRVIWLMLRGECMRVPIYAARDGSLSSWRGPGSKLKRVLILDPIRFQHVIEDHQLIGWRFTGAGPRSALAGQVFLPEEVWFEKLPNPFDFWRGCSPLYVANVAAQTDFAAAGYMRGLIENNGDCGVIVRSEKQMSDEQKGQVIAALKDRKRRAGTADRPVFLNGVTEIVKPQLSSSDLQFLENRKFSRAEICAAFGVPEEIITSTEHAKYDVMAGARLNFIENRVAPLCSRLEAEEDITVKALDPHASGWFDLESLPILQQARRARLAAARAGFDMGVPFNDLNRVLDLGFDPLPWGDRGYIASKLQEIGSRSSTSRDHARGWDAAPSPNTAPSDFLKRAECLFTNLNPQPSGLHATLARKFRRFLFEQRTRALSKVGQASRLTTTNPLPNSATPSDPPAQRSKSKSMSDLPNPAVPPGPPALTLPPLLDLTAENQHLRAALEPALLVAWHSAISEPPASHSATPTEYIESRASAWHSFNRSTLESIEWALRAGLAQAETAHQLAARIKSLYNQISASAPEQLAQTEASALNGFLRSL